MTEHAVSGRRPVAGPRGPRDWLTRNWHYVLLSLWTIGWFVDMAPAGGSAWVFFRSGTAALFGEPGSFQPPGDLHLYVSHPSLQIGPLSFAVAEVLRHLGPDSGITVAEILLTGALIGLIAAIESLARTVRPELRDRPTGVILLGVGARIARGTRLLHGRVMVGAGDAPGPPGSGRQREDADG